MGRPRAGATPFLHRRRRIGAHAPDRRRRCVGAYCVRMVLMRASDPAGRSGVPARPSGALGTAVEN